MTLYKQALRGMIGDVTVEAVIDEDKEPIPAIHIAKNDTDFPLDLQKVAANLVDILNDRTPRYQLDPQGYKIFYSRADVAILLHSQKDGEGLSIPGMTIVVSDKSTASDLGRAALDKLTPDAMKMFCDAVAKPLNPGAGTSGIRPGRKSKHPENH